MGSISNEKLFELLENCINELNSTNSTNEKKKILSKYPELIEILNYVYDPFKKYYIKSKQLDKHILLNEDIELECNIYNLLDKLYKRNVTGYNAVSMINYFISHNKKYEHLIRLILDKNLKCRIDAKIINKVYPNTVPVFNVVLAQKFDEKMTKKKDWNWTDWIGMRKLDGIRCICIIDKNSNAKFYSRTGKEFNTLDKIASEIKLNGIKDMVLDGELCIVDQNGNEDFSQIAKEYNRKNHTIENPKYIVFDQLTNEEFVNGISNEIYSKRLELKENLFDKKWITIKKIYHFDLLSNKDFTLAKETAIKKGWEGLILRKNVGYEGKRTKNLLKVKQFHEAEYIVKDVENGTMRIINKDSGLEEEITTLSNIFIEHKGFNVSVGSGFSIDERKFYYENPNEIIGKEITVKYFEESKNQNGRISLRFPTVKKIWKNKRDI